MSNTALNSTAAMSPIADMDALDAALADFELDSADNTEESFVEDALEEIVEVEASEVLDDDALADLDLAIERKEAYAEQTSGASIETMEAPDTSAPAPKAKAGRTKKAAGTKKASSGTAPVRTPRDISTVADEFFVLTGDPAALDDEAKASARAATMALKPAQVKVADKFENLFTALSVGKEPSTYVMIAFRLLDEKKAVTSGDVVGAYKTSGLGEGTARSQSGQIMNLFATVGIATRSGQTLTLNEDSTIAGRIRALTPTTPAS